MLALWLPTSSPQLARLLFAQSRVSVLKASEGGSGQFVIPANAGIQRQGPIL
jgi:hypothetical protein